MNLSLNSLPQIKDSDLKTEKGIKELKDYLYQLTEQLRYVLNNIDLDNIGGDLSEMTANVQSQMVKLNNKIGLIVTENNGTDTVASASIIAAINNGQSTVQIAADKVEMAAAEAIVQKINSAGGGVKLDAEVLGLDDYATKDQAYEYAATSATEAIQTAEGFIQTALEQYTASNDFETFQNSVTSTLLQLAEKIEFNFESSQAYTGEVNDAAQTRIDNILSFVRLLPTLSASEQGGVVIGESTNPIKMKLENDILFFYTGQDYEVTTANAIAYFASGKLYVNEAQVMKITFGTADANMNITIVGTGDNRCALFSGRLA